jgi:hypothetical protein
MSLVEPGTNVIVGYGIAVLTQIVAFPLFGLSATIGQNLAIGAIFTVVSLARSYLLRRLFEASCRSITPTGRTGSRSPG